MLSRNPKKRPTLDCIADTIVKWKMNENKNDNPWYNFINNLVDYILDRKHTTFRAERNATCHKDKIISKSRPLKIKKEHQRLQ